VISTNIQKIKSEIKKNCELSGKDPEKLVLIGASKSQPVEKIQEAYEAGLKNFGENYLQEAESKIGKLSKTIIWHFIGSVQSRKAKKIAEIFDWVHTLDSIKVARKLNDARPKSKGALNVCIQVNIDLEETKSGIHEKDLENFLEETLSLENIKVRGLMAIPRPRPTIEEQKEIFNKIEKRFSSLSKKAIGFDTLSMGMSTDYGAAIQEGATMIRIGTGIFGPRK
jgi:pyridoxal phosphate enzyme (YggS family)